MSAIHSRLEKYLFCFAYLLIGTQQNSTPAKNPSKISLLLHIALINIKSPWKLHPQLWDKRQVSFPEQAVSASIKIQGCRTICKTNAIITEVNNCTSEKYPHIYRKVKTRQIHCCITVSLILAYLHSVNFSFHLLIFSQSSLQTLFSVKLRVAALIDVSGNRKDTVKNYHIPTRMLSKAQNYSSCCLFLSTIICNVHFKNYHS